MAALEAGMEWPSLRALVDTNPWEFCVIWRLGDDPSRFIQWGTCCCSGAEHFKLKEENGLQKSGWCRDEFVKHPVNTLACKKLANLPSVIPLYSGIHGDVVTSRQPVWAVPNYASSSDDEINGTHVLIPVACGLIEFFSSKDVARDDKFIDYISACFLEKAIRINLSLKNPFLEYNSDDFSVKWPINGLDSLEGSPTCSSLSTEHNQNLKLGLGCAFGSKEHLDSPISGPKFKRKKHLDPALVHANEQGDARNRPSAEKGPYKSKNLVTERNRRKRIKAGMFALRALVPKITKMDRVATLGDAAEYIEELHETIETYNDEIRALESEACNKSYVKSKQTREIAEKATPVEVQVEVSQIGARDFLLKLVCEHRRGSFTRLMEAVDSLGLEVIDANATAFNGMMLNVLRVEANKEVDARMLKRLLIQVVT